MTACAYRSLEPVLLQRVAELRERREQDAMLVDVARRVACRRIGRAVGGGVGVVAGLAAFLVGLGGFPTHDGPVTHTAQLTSTALLFLAWPVALVAGGVARVVARVLLARGARVSFSGDAARDLRALEAADPLRDTCDRAMAWERASAALPLAAVSLLAPLTIHGLVWTGLAPSESFTSAVADFGAWIGLSVVLVGHAHLALLVCAVRWAFTAPHARDRRAARRPRPGVGQGARHQRGHRLPAGRRAARHPAAARRGDGPALRALHVLRHGAHPRQRAHRPRSHLTKRATLGRPNGSTGRGRHRRRGVGARAGRRRRAHGRADAALLAQGARRRACRRGSPWRATSARWPRRRASCCSRCRRAWRGRSRGRSGRTSTAGTSSSTGSAGWSARRWRASPASSGTRAPSGASAPSGGPPWRRTSWPGDRASWSAARTTPR